MVSDERHPLLEEHLLQIKFGAEKLTSDDETEHHSKQSASTEPLLQDSIDVLGTLTLDDEHGEAKFFGSSAGSEVRFVFSCITFAKRNPDTHDGRKSEVNGTCKYLRN